MSASATYSYDILVKTGSAIPTLEKVGGVVQKVTKIFEGAKNVVKKFGGCSFAFDNMNDQLLRMQNALNSAIAPGVTLDASMKDLSAVTGQTGKGLQAIEKYARQTAKAFGGEASQAAESYKLILSQLSPEIAQCPEALKAMGNSAAIISKLMGGDVTAATSVLTTAINQFQVSLANPIEASKEMSKMMNIMAAAAQAGSAELPAIQQALTQCGMAAKGAGISFAETNSAIQVLDKAGKKGSEGGVALRNVMATLAQGRFLPKDVQEELHTAGISINDLGDTTKTLSERLMPLKAVMNDAALISKLFGKENANAAIALLSGTDQMDGWTQSISGTNSATAQAQVVMSSYTEKMSRLKAQMDDWKISIFSLTKNALPAMQMAMTGVQTAAGLLSTICGMQTVSETALGGAIIARVEATKVGTIAMWGNIKAMFSSQNLFKLYHTSIFMGGILWQVFKNCTKSATQSILGNLRSLWASVTSMGFYSAALGLASIATYAFSASIRSLSKAIYAIPIIGWIAAGISLLIGGFALLWNKSEKFRQIIFSIWEVVKTVFYNIGMVIKSVFENIVKPCILFVFDLFKSLALGIWDAMQWCWTKIIEGLSIVGNFFVGIWTWVKDGVVGVFSGIGDIFGGVWDWITEKTSIVTSSIVNAFNFIIEPIKKVFTSIGDFFSRVWDKIMGGLSKPFKSIKGMWNKVFPKDKFKSIEDAVEKGKKKGSESWNKSEKAKEKETTLTKVTNPKVMPSVAPITTHPTLTSVAPNKKSKSSSISSENTGGSVNLNNIKGTSAYGAIVAKLNPTSFSGLGGGIAKLATSVALTAGISSSPLAIPSPESSPYTPHQEYRELPKEEPKGNKIQFAKFCEQVVINVPEGTTKVQVDAIIKELMQKINSVA